MSKIKEVISSIIRNVPGVVGVFLIDIDGIPIEIAGTFDMNTEDLGALLAVCYNSYAQVGLELGQNLKGIIVEYGDLKLCQNGMPRGLLTIVADNKSLLGMIRLEAKRAIETLSQIMGNTQELRKELMEENKFRSPDEISLDDIMSKLTKQVK